MTDIRYWILDIGYCEKGVVPDCCTNTDWRKTELSRASASKSARRSERANWLICNVQLIIYQWLLTGGSLLDGFPKKTKLNPFWRSFILIKTAAVNLTAS
jgi:hypothetical protein